jgi:hypothetical protein
LLAHIAVLGVWMATRAPERFAEPPTISVTLVSPPHAHEARKPRTAAPSPGPPRRGASPPEAHVSPTPVAPAPIAPRVLSDEDLLAGRPTDAGQVKNALNQRRHVSPWDGCNKLPGPPDWRAPPCPNSGSNDQAETVLSLRDPSHGGFAGAAAAKSAMKAYREKEPPPGPADPREFPGFRCTLLHRC